MPHEFDVICRERRCQKPVPRGAAFYCPDHTKELIEHLNTWIEDIMDVAQKVYLGRTNHPERRLLEHHHKEGRDYLAVFHWASDWAEADSIERLVISRFSHKAKLQNVSSDADGRHNGAWNCIYASWAWKASIKPLQRIATPVETLCWRKRVWPDAAVPMEPNILVTNLARDDAGALVAAWRESLRG